MSAMKMLKFHIVGNLEYKERLLVKWFHKQLSIMHDGNHARVLERELDDCNLVGYGSKESVSIHSNDVLE